MGGSCVHKPVTWQKWSKVHCANSSIKSFTSAAAAMQYCQQQGVSKCSGVYDDSCDGKGTFHACNTKAFASSSMGSCVHKLAGYGLLTTKKPTTKKPTTTKDPKKWLKMHCAGNYVENKSFKTFADASKYCHSMGSKCGGVYDDSCDNKGTFYACDTQKLQSSGMGSCVHKPVTWQKWSKVHCANSSIKSFTSAAAAMQYCQKQGVSKCSGVYDDSCDGKGTFHACNTKAFASSSMG